MYIPHSKAKNVHNVAHLLNFNKIHSMLILLPTILFASFSFIGMQSIKYVRNAVFSNENFSIFIYWNAIRQTLLQTAIIIKIHCAIGHYYCYSLHCYLILTSDVTTDYIFSSYLVFSVCSKRFLN